MGEQEAQHKKDLARLKADVGDGVEVTVGRSKASTYLSN